MLDIPVWLDVVRASRRRSIRHPKPPGYSRQIEPLEQRMLFSVAGTLDPTFGVGGQVTVTLGGGTTGAPTFTTVRNSAAQPDGKVVIVGAASNPAAGAGTTQVAVGRINADGTPDTTFGTNGLVVIPAPTAGTNTDYGSGVAIDSNGGIVVSATFSTITNGVTTSDQFAVARLLPSGAPDPAFGGAAAGGTGVVVANFPAAAGTSASLAEAHAVTIQPDGKIVAGGVAAIDPATGASEVGLARYNADGSPDTTFGTGGTTAFTLSGNAETAYNLILQQDNKILVVGSDFPATSTAGSSTSQASFLVARVNTDGGADPSFGKGGFVTTSFAQRGQTSSMSAAAAVALSDDGTVYAGGLTVTTDAAGNPSAKFALAQYNPAGKPNRRFGRSGQVQTSLGQFASVNHVTIRPDDSVVVSGIAASDAQNQAGGIFSSVVAEYTNKGVLNPFFGNKGVLQLLPKSPAGTAGATGATRTVAPSARAPAAAGRSLVALAGSGNLFQQFQKFEKTDAAIALALGRKTLLVGSSAGQVVAAQLVSPGSDVAVLSVGGLKSSSILGGSKGAVAVVVSNEGDQALAGPVTLTLSLSASPTVPPPAGGAVITTLSPTLKLKPNQQKSLKVAFNFPSTQPAGSYVLTAEVNPNSITDTSSADNAASSVTAFTLAPAFVDLGGTFATLPPSLVPGQKTTVTLNVENTGNIPAKGQATITLVASPDQTAANGTPLNVLKPVTLSLKPGASKSVKVAALVPATLGPGTDFLFAVITAPTLNDTNLANNTLVSATPVTVG